VTKYLCQLPDRILGGKRDLERIIDVFFWHDRGLIESTLAAEAHLRQRLISPRFRRPLEEPA
jgi:hypothetical protein